MPNIGILLAQRLTSALSLHGIMFDALATVVYDELLKIAHEQVNGDWLEMPNGDTYTKTFTV